MTPPIFFWMRMFLVSTFPSSSTALHAFTTMSARAVSSSPTDLPVRAVAATCFRTLSDLASTAMPSRISTALTAAILNPLVMTVGWTLALMSSSDCLSSSPARTTLVVVPSPHSVSWVLATSTTILAAGCWTSISFRMVTPSLVMTTSPMVLTSILSIPLGPRVDLTASATALAAEMLLNCASLSLLLSVPSLSTMTGWFPLPYIGYAPFTDGSII